MLHLLCSKVLQSYRSLALCPSGSSRNADIPMFTCATSNFHGNEWFGNVSIKMECEGKEERTLYGQLCLLLKCSRKLEMGENVVRELCLVQMYEDIGLHINILLLSYEFQEWATPLDLFLSLIFSLKIYSFLDCVLPYFQALLLFVAKHGAPITCSKSSLCSFTPSLASLHSHYLKSFTSWMVKDIVIHSKTAFNVWVIKTFLEYFHDQCLPNLIKASQW